VLLLATVLVNPHVNPYDLIVITPVFIAVAGWAVAHRPTDRRVWVLLFLCYYLPAISFLPTLTHVQVSVIAFVALTAILMGIDRSGAQPASGAIT
jgi:hypothetical protein